MTDLERYYQGAATGEIDEAIKESLRGDAKEVVYGAQSVNIRMPEYLRKWTEDYDIYSHTPQETAKEMESLLDETFGGDYFIVVPARHRGTFRVISKVTRRSVADVTMLDKTIFYQVINGIQYATLDEQVANIRRSLADPKSKFRWNRDREALQRIQLFKKRSAREVITRGRRRRAAPLRPITPAVSSLHDWAFGRKEV